jgi:methyl-accepting chemotaxis protein
VHTLQRRSETIVQLNPMPILLLDPAFKIHVTNEAFEKMSGVSQQQLLSMSARDFKVLEQKGEGLKQVIQQKKRSYGEITVELPNGRHILEQWGIPILDDAGGLVNLLVVYKEVTDLRRKEQEIQTAFAELSEFKQRANAIIQQNPFAMVVWDPALRIIETNEAFLRLSGWSREKTLGLTINDFKYISKSGEGFDVALKEKRASVGDAAIEFPTGVRVLERHTIPFLTAKGEVGSLLTVYNDITEKRARDQEIARLMDESRNRAERLAQSAREVEVAVSALAKGDLTVTPACGTDDPLQKVKADYAASITAIRALLDEVLLAVRQVESTTQDVTKATAEIAKATTQVATSTQMSSEFAGKQLEQIEGVGKEISDLSASVEEIASTSHTVMERAQTVAVEGNQAKDLGNQANAKMQSVERIARQSVEEITRLNDQMREIAKIVKLITDIANQTNLLALNAAIEAARAGEHGRGFAVVAGEVRNLAGESKKATAHIEEVITTITANSARTASSMQTAYGEITDGISGVQKTIDALNRIITDVGTVANGITEISRATEEQANATNRVMERMDQATHLTKESMKQIEEMAALAEEVSASTEEVGSGAQELSSMAAGLKGKMEQLRLQ